MKNMFFICALMLLVALASIIGGLAEHSVWVAAKMYFVLMLVSASIAYHAGKDRSYE